LLTFNDNYLKLNIFFVFWAIWPGGIRLALQKSLRSIAYRPKGMSIEDGDDQRFAFCSDLSTTHEED
jgi:hypothetical protein